MATIGTISINLVARTEAFMKGMSKSRRSIAALEKATVGTMRTVKMFGAVAAGAAVYGTTRLVKSSMENIDAVAKLSDRLGVSTEFLSAFGHQAALSGSSLDGLGKGIQYMLKNIGEANMGMKSYQDAFSELGLSYKELEELAPEESFLKIADKLRGVESQSAKTAIAMRIFGRSGSQLLNMMESDLTGVIEEAKKLGITFDRNMAAKVEAANDAITRMKAAFEGVGNSLAIGLSPIIETIANKVTEITTGNSGLDKMQKSIERAAIASTYLHDAFTLAQGGVYAIIGAAQKLMQMSLRISVVLTDIAAKIASLLKLEGVASGIKSVADGIDEIQKEFGTSAANYFDKAKDSFFDIGKSREQMKKFFEEVENQRANVVAKSAATLPLPDENTNRALKEASAMEISRNISVSGLSIGSDRSLENINREQLSTLRVIAQNTAKGAEVLN